MGFRDTKLKLIRTIDHYAVDGSNEFGGNWSKIDGVSRCLSFVHMEYMIVQ